ncbi:hypothetical protein PAXRUDRAFT_824077 [Paxillus rubicundulus Ve08.2h10]|uniref:Uncharacterized protein n=1 Tax=Paxillus rubicundulus Ve08.2h10 TaxID=930991 RepID=A0A0D0E2H7_9AGAM|nr:hypothetical protein PAXRUDRAFT_824077 [Paxillus rubicundulus Ve08.2h10]
MCVLRSRSLIPEVCTPQRSPAFDSQSCSYFAWLRDSTSRRILWEAKKDKDVGEKDRLITSEALNR